MLNAVAISWRASRTTLIVLNAAEAELYSLSSATQEAIYLRKMCIELGFLQTNPTIMYEDCQAAVALSKENRFHNRSKHISLRWSFVVERQSLAIGDITVVGISRTGMLADIFCSPRTTSQNIWFGSEFNRCLIAPLKCVHLKKTKSNVISAETKQTLLPKQTICNNHMYLCCYANWQIFVV